MRCLGRGAPVRRYTIAAVGKIAPEDARARAKVILGLVVHGHDPAQQKTTERSAIIGLQSALDQGRKVVQ
jgi:hypothetical protein